MLTNAQTSPPSSLQFTTASKSNASGLMDEVSPLVQKLLDQLSTGGFGTPSTLLMKSPTGPVQAILNKLH